MTYSGTLFRLLVVVGALLVAGCNPGESVGGGGSLGSLRRWVDTTNGVTCYISTGSQGHRGISCLHLEPAR